MRGVRPLIVLLCAAVLAEPIVATAQPTFVVNSPFDVPADFTDNPNFDICRTSVQNSVCTLRAAIMNANHYIEGGVPTIIVPAGTYTLSIPPVSPSDLPLDEARGSLDILQPMVIRGAGMDSTVIDAAELDRVLVMAGRETLVSDLTLTRGRAPSPGIGGGGIVAGTQVTLERVRLTDNSGDAGGGLLLGGGSSVLNGCRIDGNRAQRGGGIYNGRGALELNDCVVENNVARRDGGGGIYALTMDPKDPPSVVKLVRTTIRGNRATPGEDGTADGGGVFLADRVELVAERSTFDGNVAEENGGAISAGTASFVTLTASTVSANAAFVHGGGISTLFKTQTNLAGFVHLYGATIAGNVADADRNDEGAGGGIFRVEDGPPVTIANTLLAENYAGLQANDCGGAPLTSEDYNFIQSRAVPGTCLISAADHDAGDADPMIGPLRQNGGGTATRGLLPGSPAIDQVPPERCRDAVGTAPVPDQRGLARPIGPLCDIGAFEGKFPRLAYGLNLIRNGDAESSAGSPVGASVGEPSWTAVEGHLDPVRYGAPFGFPDPATDPVPADRGFNFFAGGPHQVSRARQTIDLLPLGADIFDEIVHYTFSAALGGFATDEDNAMLSMSFLDVASNPLGPPITLGPVTAADRGLATGFVNRSVEGTLPGATARIRVELAFTIASGFYNDGYADNLSLVLDSPREPRCAGDCAGARRVGTEDIVLLVDIALGNATTSACPLGIPEGASVTAPLIVEAVRHTFDACLVSVEPL